ncbi:MAG: hypothetical protein PHY56_00110 [Candidatus Omnitrophica bacterium]|nr:hypothetical protein [Candidatus Omnitrophota bacterium]
MEETKEQLIKRLRALMTKGNRTIYSVVRHVSSSGMSRVIDFFTIIKNKPYNLSYYAEKLLDYKYDRNYAGVRVSGCGMDMCFSVVYDLGRTIYPKGDGKTITHRNGDTKPETDGGYLLRSENI